MQMLIIKMFLYKKKQTYIYLLIFLILCICLLMFYVKFEFLNNKIDTIRASTLSRELLVRIENDEIKLDQIIRKEDIEKKYIYFEPFFAKLDNKYRLKLQCGILENIPTILKGRNIDNMQNEILTPDSIYIDGKKKDLSDYLGSTVHIRIDNGFDEYYIYPKVVGVFENDGFNNAYVSQYISKKNNFNKNINDFLVIMKKNKNINNIINYSSNNDVKISLFDESIADEKLIYENISNYVKIIFYVILFFSVLSIFIFVKDLLFNLTEDLFFLKIYGYSLKLIFYYLFFALCLVFIFPCVLCEMAIYIMLLYLEDISFRIVTFIMFKSIFFIILIIIMLLKLIRHVKKNNFIDLNIKL